MIIGLLIFFILLSVYLGIVRPLLKAQPTLSAAFAAEAPFWEKVQAKVTGWRTKIVARLLAIGAFFIGLYDQVLPLAVGQDWTPITAKMPSWTLPVGMVAVSFLVLKLKDMTKRAPQIITQKDDDGVPKVVAVEQPVKV